MQRFYGIPYKGSKNSIARAIVTLLPARTHFYDLFCGGGAVTHAAMEAGKWRHYAMNDIDPLLPRLFTDAARGKYAHESRWISRADFFRLKDTDGYVKTCWSFGNNGRSYLYSRELEDFKRAVWALCFGSELDAHELQTMLFSRVFGSDEHYRILFDLDALAALYAHPACDNRFKLRTLPCRYLDAATGSDVHPLLELERYWKKRIQSDKRKQAKLTAAQRLQSLESLESLESYAGDYRAVPIAPDSVIYCDIPYKGTSGYNRATFDHAAFYDWALKQTELVVISEYTAPADFECVAAFTKRCTLSASANTNVTTERLFVPKRQLHLWLPVQVAVKDWQQGGLFCA